MELEEFNRIKAANEAAVFPDKTITKLCAAINRLREECGILASERDDANLQLNEVTKQRDLWEADAKRLTQNSDHWREKFEKAKAKNESLAESVSELDQRLGEAHQETRAAERLNGELKGRLDEIQHIATLFWNGKPEGPLGMILDILLSKTEKRVEQPHKTYPCCDAPWPGAHKPGCLFI